MEDFCNALCIEVLLAEPLNLVEVSDILAFVVIIIMLVIVTTQTKELLQLATKYRTCSAQRTIHVVLLQKIVSVYLANHILVAIFTLFLLARHDLVNHAGHDN